MPNDLPPDSTPPGEEHEDLPQGPYIEEESDPPHEAYDPYVPPVGNDEAEEARGPSFLEQPAPALGIGCGGCLGYFVLAQIVPGIIVAVLLLSMGKGPKNIEVAMLDWMWLITGLGALVSLGFVVLSRKLRWLDAGPEGPDALWKAVAWAVGLAAICPLGAEAISLFQLHVVNIPIQEQPLLVNAAKTSGAGFFLAIVIGAPLGEELFFRRWFYGITRKPIGPWLAFLVSGIAFATIHFNFTAFVAYLWIAGCCTLAYERSGSIWGAVFVHFVNNSIAAVMLSLA